MALRTSSKICCAILHKYVLSCSRNVFTRNVGTRNTGLPMKKNEIRKTNMERTENQNIKFKKDFQRMPDKPLRQFSPMPNKIEPDMEDTPFLLTVQEPSTRGNKLRKFRNPKTIPSDFIPTRNTTNFSRKANNVQMSTHGLRHQFEVTKGRDFDAVRSMIRNDLLTIDESLKTRLNINQKSIESEQDEGAFAKFGISSSWKSALSLAPKASARSVTVSSPANEMLPAIVDNQKWEESEIEDESSLFLKRIYGPKEEE